MREEFPPPPFYTAILGGTGAYRGARGEMHIDPATRPGTATPPELGVVNVIFASAFASLAGWALLALLEKVHRQRTPDVDHHRRRLPRAVPRRPAHPGRA